MVLVVTLWLECLAPRCLLSVLAVSNPFPRPASWLALPEKCYHSTLAAGCVSQIKTAPEKRRVEVWGLTKPTHWGTNIYLGWGERLPKGLHPLQTSRNDPSRSQGPLLPRCG